MVWATQTASPITTQVANATHQGFLSGLNTILMIGGGVALAGALVAAWLVREHEIEREVIPAGAVPEPIR